MQTETEEPIAVLLADVTRLFWRRLEVALKAAGLHFTAGEARTLVSVSCAEGLRQAVLAERMRIEPMTLVGFIDRLEARGLLARAPDPADRRAKLVHTTPAATGLVEKILDVGQGVKADVTAGLGPAEVEILRDMLMRIRGNLVALHEGQGAAAS